MVKNLMMYFNTSPPPPIVHYLQLTDKRGRKESYDCARCFWGKYCLETTLQENYSKIKFRICQITLLVVILFTIQFKLSSGANVFKENVELAKRLKEISPLGPCIWPHLLTTTRLDLSGLWFSSDC